MNSTPPPFVRGFSKNRLEGLIDGIFAVALTRLVVGLIKRRNAPFTVVPLLSMLVAFYSTHFSLYVYIVLICAHFFPGRIDEHIHTTPEGALGSKDP